MSETPGDRPKFKSVLKAGIERSRAKLAELEASEDFGPALAEGHRAAARGARVAGDAYTKAAGAISQEQLWDEAHSLLRDLVDVVSIQQGMIEQLRERVVELEQKC